MLRYVKMVESIVTTSKAQKQNMREDWKKDL